MTYQIARGVMAVLACSLVAGTACAEPATFTLLSSFSGMKKYVAEGVTDGATAALGTASTKYVLGQMTHAYLWTAENGMQSLPHLPGQERSESSAFSADGMHVVGNSYMIKYSPSRAFRWSQASGISPLSSLLNAKNQETFAYGISGNGARVVGTSRDAGNRRCAVYWDGDAAPVSLTFGDAIATSHDGSAIAGNYAYSDRAFHWTQETGLVTIPFANGLRKTSATAISDDGRVVIGTIWDEYPTPQVPFMWSKDTGTVPLYPIDGWTTAEATDASADGSVIVGNLLPESNGSLSRPFYWTSHTGMVFLASVLYPAIPNDCELVRVDSVSPDGRSFSGMVHRDGEYRPFVATIPAPSVIALLCTPLLTTRRRR